LARFRFRVEIFGYVSVELGDALPSFSRLVVPAAFHDDVGGISTVI